MIKNKWYQFPTQVMFIPEGECPTAGIAYHDEVICGCCGGIFNMDEVLIIKEYSWEQLTEEIVGGDEEYDEVYSKWCDLEDEQLYDKWHEEFDSAVEANELV